MRGLGDAGNEADEAVRPFEMAGVGSCGSCGHVIGAIKGHSPPLRFFGRGRAKSVVPKLPKSRLTVWHFRPAFAPYYNGFSRAFDGGVGWCLTRAWLPL